MGNSTKFLIKYRHDAPDMFRCLDSISMVYVLCQRDKALEWTTHDFDFLETSTADVGRRGVSGLWWKFDGIGEEQ